MLKLGFAFLTISFLVPGLISFLFWVMDLV